MHPPHLERLSWGPRKWESHNHGGPSALGAWRSCFDRHLAKGDGHTQTKEHSRDGEPLEGKHCLEGAISKASTWSSDALNLHSCCASEPRRWNRRCHKTWREWMSWVTQPVYKTINTTAPFHWWNHESTIVARMEDIEQRLLQWTLRPGWACRCIRNTDEFVHQWGCFDVPSVSYHVESGNAPLVYSPMEKLDRFFCDTHQVIQSAICNE